MHYTNMPALCCEFVMRHGCLYINPIKMCNHELSVIALPGVIACIVFVVTFCMSSGFVLLRLCTVVWGYQDIHFQLHNNTKGSLRVFYVVF